MAHDFAKRAEQHKRKLAPKKKKGGLSVGLILTTLILVSGFVTFLVYLAKVKPQTTSEPAVATQKEPSSKKKITPPASIQQPKDLYDFYTLLPESEVIAPKVDAYQSKPKNKNSENYAYMLQAGSFRNTSDAERLRAKLILHGLTVKSNRIEAKSGTWYRVLVGPFTSRSDLNRAQDILARANTESMLIKVKP